ncbi:MAG: hypothetical protein O2897_02005 [bacterium]|nr:hypothetical protein [bacterium]
MPINSVHHTSPLYIQSPLRINNEQNTQRAQTVPVPDHVIIDIPEDEYPEYQPTLQNDASKAKDEPVKDGAAMGFIAGMTASIIGIPVLLVIKAEADKKISPETAKNINGILVPLALPGLFLGLTLMPVGAVIGGFIKLCKHLHHRIHDEKQD